MFTLGDSPRKILTPHLVCSSVFLLVLAPANWSTSSFRRTGNLSVFFTDSATLGSWYSSWRPNTQLPIHHVKQTVIQLHISHCHRLQPASIALKTLPSVPILDCVSPGFGGQAFSNSCHKYNFFLPAGLPKSGKITSCQNPLTGSHGWRCRSSNKRTFWIEYCLLFWYSYITNDLNKMSIICVRFFFCFFFNLSGHVTVPGWGHVTVPGGLPRDGVFQGELGTHGLQ